MSARREDKMPSVIVRGRWAWICGMVLGIILVIVGAVIHPTSTVLIVAGCAFFLFGLVMLIISFATGGASD